mgnify:CR=1 FL=1
MFDYLAGVFSTEEGVKDFSRYMTEENISQKSILETIAGAVVPDYYLVCYNMVNALDRVYIAVVPGYYLVCYNLFAFLESLKYAVVPGYYLVCYN